MLCRVAAAPFVVEVCLAFGHVLVSSSWVRIWNWHDLRSERRQLVLHVSQLHSDVGSVYSGFDYGIVGFAFEMDDHSDVVVDPVRTGW